MRSRTCRASVRGKHLEAHAQGPAAQSRRARSLFYPGVWLRRGLRCSLYWPIIYACADIASNLQGLLIRSVWQATVAVAALMKLRTAAWRSGSRELPLTDGCTLHKQVLDTALHCSASADHYEQPITSRCCLAHHIAVEAHILVMHHHNEYVAWLASPPRAKTYPSCRSATHEITRKREG